MNKYGMWFCPFVGVNNHRQSIVFGLRVLANQNKDSFAWLFENFVDYVPGHLHLKIIITDQDNAIFAAVRQVFPTTIHRLCIWHILAKFSDKLCLAARKEHVDKLRSYIWSSESTVEFETRWAELMSTTLLVENKWLGNMNELQERWVPAFLKSDFSVGMTSSQRAESTYLFFKRYLSPGCSLNDLYTRFKRALERQTHLELQADHVDVNERIMTTAGNLMERQIADRYTKANFKIFLTELHGCQSYICSLKGSTQEARIYEVSPYDAGKVPDRKRQVTYDVAIEYAACSCRKFESEGIPCRHVLY